MQSPLTAPHWRLRRAFASIAFPALALAGMPAIAAVTEPAGQVVIFRYRTFSGTIPAWVSPLTSAGGIDHTAGAGDIVTIDRGAGFSATEVTDFDGTSEFVQGASSITTYNASSGEDELSIEAWFKPTDVATNVTHNIFSNAESGNGFSLRIVNGRLQGAVCLNTSGGGSTTLVAAMDATYPNLTAGRWYHGALHVQYVAPNYEARLYLDGVRVNLSTAAGTSVRQSTEKPMVGAEPSGGNAVGAYFKGQIYAVTVCNHPLYITNYLLNKVVRDAGRYFGTPSYHDYFSSTASVDFRIQTTVSDYSGSGGDLDTKVVDRMQLPFWNDKYVPQGLGYDATNGYFYVSYYWKDVDGSTASATSNPDKISFVAEIEKSTNKLRRVFRLYRPTGSTPLENYNHVGGLEFYDGDLYITYNTSIYRYPLSALPNPNYVFDPTTFSNALFDQNPLGASSTTGPLSSYLHGNLDISCLHIANDSDGTAILWTADFDGSVIRKIVGFRLSSTGAVVTPDVYSFDLPGYKCNGLACYNTTPTTVSFYVQTSVSSTDDSVNWHKVTYDKATGAKTSDTVIFHGPRGTEDMTMIGSQIWSLSETGAYYFQKRTDGLPVWDDLYPFLFGVAP